MSQLHFKIKKGLDLPITGRPESVVEAGRTVDRVALLGADTLGLRPTMHVSEGDRVKLGQPVFEDKKNPGVVFTSPGSGTVLAVNRGAKRAFQSLVVALDGDEAEEFPARHPSGSSAEEIRDVLVRSGLWTAFRTRPYSKIPAPDSSPNALFVNAMDSNPLAADPMVVIEPRADEFKVGLRALAMLAGTLFLCCRKGTRVPGEDLPGITHATFEGPHPSGLPGTHIHHLHPVGQTRLVWTIGYQDVIEIGALLETGRLAPRRVVALGGPAVNKPRLLRTRRGADLTSLVQGEVEDGARVVSGSVLCGRAVEAETKDRLGFLGRYHQQISAVPEGGERKLIGWHMPGGDQFSIMNAFISAIGRARRRFAFDTSANGSPRALVPIGTYERVVPIDTSPTFLMRSLIIGDTDMAQQLGALELDEEDLGLCTFVCPGKTDYAPLLREALTTIEKDG